MHDDDDDDGDDEKCKFERSFRVTDVDTSEVYRRVREASEDPLLRTINSSTTSGWAVVAVCTAAVYRMSGK